MSRLKLNPHSKITTEHHSFWRDAWRSNQKPTRQTSEALHRGIERIGIKCLYLLSTRGCYQQEVEDFKNIQILLSVKS